MYILNVSSGKGGTGKTLTVSVLAELLSKSGAKVLVADLDIFVRGLTSLLYFENGERLNLKKGKELSASDFLIESRLFGAESQNDACLGIQRYRNFDIIPSVARIDEKLGFEDVMPRNYEESMKRLKRLISAIPPDEYDFLIFDSRAGFDELIAATHSISNSTICIEEEDQVSAITSGNLVRQLDEVSKNPIYRIINKARQEIQNTNLGVVGSIPFDTDIMNSYGEEHFWSTIKKSLLEPSLVSAWNIFARREGLAFELHTLRHSAIPINALEMRVAKLSSYNRIMFIYGVIIALSGLLLSIDGRDFVITLVEDPYRALGIFGAIAGVTMSAFSVLKR